MNNKYLNIIGFIFVILFIYIFFGQKFIKMPQIKKEFVNLVRDNSIKTIIVYYVTKKKNIKNYSYKIILEDESIFKEFKEIVEDIGDVSFISSYKECESIYRKLFLVTLVFKNNKRYSFNFYYDSESIISTNPTEEATIIFLKNTGLTEKEYRENIYSPCTYCIENNYFINFFRKYVVTVINNNPQKYIFKLNN